MSLAPLTAEQSPRYAVPADRSNPPVASYRDLRVWSLSMDLVIRTYHFTAQFPRHETSALSNELQRSVVSVASNIAEGHGREQLGDYLHHLSIASGSLTTAETLYLIAERLAYIPTADIAPVLRQCDDISRMLAGLVKSLRRKQSGA